MPDVSFTNGEVGFIVLPPRRHYIRRFIFILKRKMERMESAKIEEFGNMLLDSIDNRLGGKHGN